MEIPKSLHDVLGEQQSKSALYAIAIFTLVGSVLIFYLMHYQMPEHTYSWWQYALGELIIIDIVAGAAANFTRGTNQYYARSAKSRWIFIVIHIHLLAVAVLFEQSLLQAVYIWTYVIVSACVLNLLFRHSLQRSIAMLVVFTGLVLIFSLGLPWWYQLVAGLFLVKVCYAFSVDHYYTKNPT
ncbi:hypothetical protein PA25_18630 [Pseudoalteromonas sp. A25]|uniref:hypothetical protein n=1 Tax=Pseudoalteromonas sp. A25 TaxID=116092 RepID=UPI001260B81B|nr:hypothetical protein [Pseudoalteromonas sp. A25]BBN81878.1 hypothetical protein PA25_18630 [Pseudoalteromonas sp. A25]